MEWVLAAVVVGYLYWTTTQ